MGKFIKELVFLFEIDGLIMGKLCIVLKTAFVATCHKFLFSCNFLKMLVKKVLTLFAGLSGGVHYA